MHKQPSEEILAELLTIRQAKFLTMLSDKRVNDPQLWLEVGQILFSIGQKCDEALLMWIEFTKRSTKFSTDDCRLKWETMKSQGRTAYSIRAMALTDNPVAYNAWYESEMNVLMMNTLDTSKPTSYDVSKVVKFKYQDKLVCTDSKKNIWYEFREHRWYCLDDKETIRDLIADVSNDFCKLRIQLARTNRNRSDLYKLEQDDRVARVCSELRMEQFIGKMLRQCKTTFYDQTFEQKLDKNVKLFVCENGVLDLERGLFRDGRPDDFCSISCKLMFPQTINLSDSGVAMVTEFLHRIFTDPIRYNCFLDTVSSCLQGASVSKTILFHIGHDDSGRALTCALIGQTFGDYYNFLDKKRLTLSKCATPASRIKAANLHHQRVVISGEIDDKKLDINALKSFGCEDPRWMLMVQVDEMPYISADDHKLVSKIQVLEYTSMFVQPDDLEQYPVPTSTKGQFKIRRFGADQKFESDMHVVAPAFLWLLFERFKKTHLQKQAKQSVADI